MKRLQKAFCMLLAVMLLTPVICSGAEGKRSALSELDFSRKISGKVQVPGRGEMRYYAQNDPLWGQMAYRFPGQENTPRFSGSGCVPSALANCFANVLRPEEMTIILSQAFRESEGYRICSCSMNRKGCYQGHERYQLTTTLDLQIFFSLVMGAYMSGNNPTGATSNGSFGMIWELKNLFGLTCDRVSTLSEAAKLIGERDGMAVLLVGGDDNPFTSTGHALTLCGATDEEYFFLDSFCRETYELDKFGCIRVLEPGLVAVPRDKAFRLGAYSIHVIARPQETAQ